ncbi:Na+:solute symporter [Leptospira sp. 96542]|nr:Na+:solute symporter [Leptospira sp. 96542]
MIQFHFWDYVLFISPFLVILGLLYKYRSKAKSTNEYFKAEGNLSWFVAGTAMVATTFAADTPLAVTEIIRSQGIVGNWLWWYMSIGGFVTVFFFAKLWKRSKATTDLELIYIRYSGKEAEFLRSFKAVVIGLILNLIILGWVNLAMLKILPVFFPLYSPEIILAFLLVFGVFYTAIAGLRGISYIDVFQFFLAWIGCFLFAYFALELPQIEGLDGLKSKLPQTQLEFFPSLDKEGLPFDHFIILISVIWWSSWYPGSEPGGGGYIAQRILSTKNEDAALKSSLWFVIAHYFVRPWPWIIVALVSVVLFPNLSESESGSGFLMVLQNGMPNGMKGLLLSAFLAAYLSTLATHLNWGASYLVNDLWKPILKNQKGDSYFLKLSYVLQIFTASFAFLLAVYGMDTVKGAWVFLLEASSGIGFVLIVRWFYWRFSAKTEILAFILSPFVYLIVLKCFNSIFPYTVLYTSLSTAIILIVYSYIFPSTNKDQLKEFYHLVKPPFYFWKGLFENEKIEIYNNHIGYSILGVVSGLLFVFSGLYLVQSILWDGGFIIPTILFTMFGLVGLGIAVKKITSNN